MDAKLERKVFELSHACSEGIADETGIQELEGYLRADAEARKIYLQVMDMHFDLDRQSMIGSLAPKDSAGQSCELLMSELDEVEIPVSSKKSIVYWALATAACLAISLLLIKSDLFSSKNYEAIVIEGSGTINELPVAKGVKINFHDLISLKENQKIKLEFRDKTVLEIDGPTSAFLEKFNVDGRLLKLAGDTENADKFTVSSGKTQIQLKKTEPVKRKIKVVESGNAFAIKVDPEYTEIHVFEGRITSVSSTSGLPGETTTLNQLQAARFNKKGNLKKWTTPDFEGFKLTRKFKGVVSTNRHVHFISNRPKTLKEGGLESNSSIFLIPEKKGVVLQKDLKVSFTEKLKNGGTQSAFDSHIRSIPKGTKVDSYLLHFDPAEDKFLDGEIVFDRPILALIANTWQLDESDSLFALNNCKYPVKSYRGLDDTREKEKNDVLIFLRDPHKVRARFNIKTATVDQMRILILSD